MFRKGTTVTWKWGSHRAEGKIAEIFTSAVTRTIKGEKVTRKASDAEPAYLIEQNDGGKVLKSRAEIERAKT